MKKMYCVFSAVVFFLVFILAGCGGGGGGGTTPTPTPTTASLSGTITTQSGLTLARIGARGERVASAITPGGAVQGAAVYLEDNPNITTKTDSSGAFTLTGIPAGNHDIIAEITDASGNKHYPGLFIRSGFYRISGLISRGFAGV
ncbi:MAG: carboxypeptidase-like regulatory domain-containing protein [bacterium]